MRVLVTGADGLVGSTISSELKLYNRNQLDLKDYNKVCKYLQATNPDAIIHTAARVGGLGANMSFPSDFYEDNILINTNLLSAAQKNGVRRVISFLSTCIFPDKTTYPLTEDMLHNGEPHPSNFAYAYAKRMLEVHSRAIASQYNLNYSCVIPTNIYGPNDNFNLESGHVIPSLIHKCYLAKRDKTDFLIWGSGKPLREFIYSHDVGKLVELLLEKYEGPGSVILSTSEEVSIGHVASIVAECMGFGGRILYDDTKSDGQYKKTTSNKKLLSIIPDYKFTPLERGIQQTVNWFIGNYHRDCRR